MMKNRDYRQLNSGFSYIELIVVIAILGIMVGMVGLSYGLVTSNNVSKAAEKCGSAISKAKTATMAKGTKNGSLELIYDSGTFYYCIGNPSEIDSKKNRERLCQMPVEILLVTEHGLEYKLTEIGHYTYKFNRATGGLKTDEYTTVRFTNGNNTCDVLISELTGRISVEKR